GTDYVDVYLVHVYDPSTPLDETMRALDDIVRAGKARYIGCCNFAAWQVCRGNWLAERAHGAPFRVVQNEYSLLTRGPEQELFGVVSELGLGMMAYSPLAIGLLSGLYTPGAPPPPDSFWEKRGADAYAR